MRTSTLRVVAAAAAVAAIVWASAAAAAPASEKHCGMARGWVEDHCSAAAKVATRREGTPARCGRARAWLVDHCWAKADFSVKETRRGKSRLASRYERKHKRAHKSHGRVYVYVERGCCRGAPLTVYRTTPYRDNVFPTDFVPRPGWEWQFFSAYERNLR